MAKLDSFEGATEKAKVGAFRGAQLSVVDLAAKFAERGIVLGEDHEFEK